jgi:hypothetical protein
VAIRADAPATPRTVTVRVRTLVIAAAVLAVAAVVFWSLHWATSIQPLSAGAMAGDVKGLDVPTETGGQMGPAVHRWKRGGRYWVTLWLSNSASVPITVTGAGSTGTDWGGNFTGPTIAIGHGHDTRRYYPFHPVEIPAGGTRTLAFVFHANPAACRYGAGLSTADSVTVHFTMLSMFHDSQTIPLDTFAFNLERPTKTACAAT